MRRIALGGVHALASMAPAQASIVSWRAADGLAPYDLSRPASHRFALEGASGFMNYTGAALSVVDDSSITFGAVAKTDIAPVAGADPWAFQATLRVASHSRPGLDVGAFLGIDDDERRVMLAIATDRVGFGTDSGLNFVDDAFVALDATVHHTFRVVKNGGLVSLYIDDFSTAALTLDYTLFGTGNNGVSKVWLANTSNPGVAAFEVTEFAFNLQGAAIPAPGTFAAVGAVTVGMLRRRR